MLIFGRVQRREGLNLFFEGPLRQQGSRAPGFTSARITFDTAAPTLA